MKINNISLQGQRNRRFLLVLPLLIFCFVSILFVTLGGGQGEGTKLSASGGLRMKLPSVMVSTRQSGNKMSFYDQASADSIRKHQLRKADPYLQTKPDSPGDPPAAYPDGPFFPHQPAPGAVDYGTGSPADNEARISRRISQLQEMIDRPQVSPAGPSSRKQPSDLPESWRSLTVAAEDPELKQMNGLLEKILDIQHPERVAPVQEKNDMNPAVKRFRAIPAMIDGNQKIVQGTVVRLQLSDTVRLGGQLFAKGQRLYGIGILSNQRCTVNIQSIHVGNSFYPVDLTVFDETDGLEGISVPEAITADALRDGAGGGVQQMDLTSFDPSVTGQLTTAGINTAKGLFGKKIRRVKGKLKDGHAVLLRDNGEVKNNR
ncbi:conjugative transposon protein TraM [Mucilaginibacter aquaedulcis]|uniref:conjugative transposon protein TraM n=1 Tax=Mucilaginibacter aquaedulcis TaxID=1187081 RepID=UPI0025B5AB08|nr:conjugative transposon protein TraM [Mucilaginibacter aquaedulcis]MDN3548976.1 conjugative transposon protein TraM [Mucilaginibacter aquaedulcis]